MERAKFLNELLAVNLEIRGRVNLKYYCVLPSPALVMILQKQNQTNATSPKRG